MTRLGKSKKIGWHSNDAVNNTAFQGERNFRHSIQGSGERNRRTLNSASRGAGREYPEALARALEAMAKSTKGSGEGNQGPAESTWETSNKQNRKNRGLSGRMRWRTCGSEKTVWRLRPSPWVPCLYG